MIRGPSAPAPAARAAVPAALPEGFLDLPALVYEDDPMWIPEEPEDVTAAFSPANPWLDEGRAATWCIPGRARVAAFWHPATLIGGEPAAFFGYWETTGDHDASAALFAEVATWARGQGALALYGPVNFTTYGIYRLRVSAEAGAVTFPGEPYNPPGYPALLESLGFTAHHHYNTRLFDLTPELLDGLLASFRPVREQLFEEGFRFVPLDEDLWMRSLPEVHALVDSAFGDNFAYTPLPYETFARVCGRAFIRKASPQASMMAFAPDGSVAAFIMSYPHYGPLVTAGAGQARVRVSDLDVDVHLPRLVEAVNPDRPAMVGKTAGTRPDLQRRGLQPALYATCIEGMDGAFGSGFGALSRDDNPTQGYAAGADENVRWYALYRKDLQGPAPLRARA